MMIGCCGGRQTRTAEREISPAIAILEERFARGEIDEARVRAEASDPFQIPGRALFRCTDQKRLLLTLAATPKRHQDTRFHSPSAS